MVFPNIEKIKQEYTDKYVVVDAQRPELARFADVVGQVKTVNMNGRALVEFLDYHLNIGWYDIELEYLKIVDKPLPAETAAKTPPKRAHDKPEGKAAPTTGAKQIVDSKATPSTATSKEGAGAKPSTADILSKLRGGGGAPASAAKPSGGEKPSTADILAKLRGGAGAPTKKDEPVEPTAKSQPETTPAADAPAKIDRSKMSVAEMLAAARAGGSGGGASPAKVEPEAKATPSPPETASVPSGPSAEAGSAKKLDRSKMSVADMLAAARAGGAKAQSAPAAAPAPAAQAESPGPVAEAPAPTPAAPAAEQVPPAASQVDGGIVKIDKSGMSIAEMVAYCREKDAS